MNEKKKKREQRDLCFSNFFDFCASLFFFFLLFFILWFLFSSLFFVLLFSSFRVSSSPLFPVCVRETALFFVSNTSLWNIIICFY